MHQRCKRVEVLKEQIEASRDETLEMGSCESQGIRQAMPALQCRRPLAEIDMPMGRGWSRRS